MPTIRAATEADADTLVEIYRPHVENTAASFELVCPSAQEFATRIATAQRGWVWLVAEERGECVSYAYASSHRARPAYRWSVETSAYVHPSHHRRGIGSMLYVELLARLKAQGFCNALAGIVLPNEASIALHTRVGFTAIGVFQRVGWKFGAWQDVAWFQQQLLDAPATGAALRTSAP